MNLLFSFFNTLFIQPLYNLLIFFIWILPGNSLGGAIILLTLLIRILLFPLQQRTIYFQLKLQEIQPKVKEVQKKFKDDMLKQAEELQKIYKEHKFNPFSNLLIWIIQIPVLYALFRVLLRIVDSNNNHLLYSFTPSPESFNTYFLGIDLSKPSLVLIAVLIFLQFLQVKFLGRNTKQSLGQKIFTFGFSIFIGLIFLRFPSALVLYILTSTLFGFIQQEFTRRKYERSRTKKSN